MKSKNNKGLTLVELILAMAISAMIIGGVTMLMSISTKRYQSEERDISIQREAQSILNQINNLVMGGNNITFDGSKLTIHHVDEDASTYDKTEVIWLDNTTHRLYLYYIKSTTDLSDMNTEISSRTGLTDHLFGEYVDSLQVTPNSLVYDRSGSLGGTVTITLNMKFFDRTYEVTQTMKPRNRIVDLPTAIPTPP